LADIERVETLTLDAASACVLSGTRVTDFTGSEVRAAVNGQRELAAYLATKFETQRIQIVDEKNVTHGGAP
jgi:hypothetical protein